MTLYMVWELDGKYNIWQTNGQFEFAWTMRTDRPSNQNSCKGKAVSQNEKSAGRSLIR